MNLKRFLLKFTGVLVLLYCFNFSSYSQSSGEIPLDNGKLHYEIFGKGKPLLLINGGPGISSKAYVGMAQELSVDRMVIIFDQRGTGRSILKEINEKTITINKMIDDIELLREKLELQKWDILGVSFGGLLACNYVQKYPQKVDRLILQSTLGMSRNRDTEINAFKEIDYVDMIAIEKELYDVLEKYFFSDYLDVDQKNKLLAGLKARYYVYDSKNINAAIHWFLNEAEHNFKVTSYANRSSLRRESRKSKKKLEKFDGKVLIIHGREDFINLTAPESLHKVFKNSQLIILDECGHIIRLDKPKILYKILMDFLNNK